MSMDVHVRHPARRRRTQYVNNNNAAVRRTFHNNRQLNYGVGACSATASASSSARRVNKTARFAIAYHSITDRAEKIITFKCLLPSKEVSSRVCLMKTLAQTRYFPKK